MALWLLHCLFVCLEKSQLKHFALLSQHCQQFSPLDWTLNLLFTTTKPQQMSPVPPPLLSITTHRQWRLLIWRCHSVCASFGASLIFFVVNHSLSGPPLLLGREPPPYPPESHHPPSQRATTLPDGEPPPLPAREPPPSQPESHHPSLPESHHPCRQLHLMHLIIPHCT